MNEILLITLLTLSTLGLLVTLCFLVKIMRFPFKVLFNIFCIALICIAMTAWIIFVADYFFDAQWWPTIKDSLNFWN